MRASLAQALQMQRGVLLCWVPVMLALGIGAYFALGQEPQNTTLLVGAGGAALLGLLALRAPEPLRPLMWGLVLISLGFGAAKLRTEVMAGPVLGYRYYGPIEGRIVNIDKSASDAVRLTLAEVVLSRMSSERTPTRVRISVHGDQPLAQFHAGERVILTGHLSPPSGPAEPGGFDFRRHVWFLQIGALGYTRTPVLRVEAAAPESLAARIFDIRMRLSHFMQTAIHGRAGAFAAAVTTGDRSGMDAATLQTLRDSNLAHLLAISGLHMGLLTGFVFATVRLGMALVPFAALRLSGKKIAALAGFVVGFAYLWLSGGSVATERAFVMVAVALVAVLLDRRALRSNG